MSLTQTALNALLETAGFAPQTSNPADSAPDKETLVSPVENGFYEGLPTRLDPHRFRQEYQEVIRLKVLGYKTIDICRTLQMTLPTVQKALNCPLGRQMLQDLQDARNGSVMDIQTRIQGMADEAADYMEAVISGDVPVTAGLKFKVAESILDRAGHGRIMKNLNIGLSGQLSDEELLRCRARAMESGLLSQSSNALEPLEPITVTPFTSSTEVLADAHTDCGSSEPDSTI